MPQPCKVCAHPARPLIDSLLAGGMGNREAGRQFGLTKDAVGRHRVNHAASEVQVSTTPTDPTEAATSALARVEDLLVRVGRVLATAERDGKSTLVLQAAREVRQATELLAKITGELDERTQVQVLNLSTDPQWTATRAALLDALRPYPEAAAAVAARLAGVESPPPPEPITLTALPPAADPHDEDLL